MIFYLYRLFRLLIFPFLYFILPIINKKAYERRALEREYSLDTDLDIDYCFEVSSEGELEQVRYLLERLLKDQFEVLLVFSSPSVLRQCLGLRERYQNLSISMYPLLSYSGIHSTPFPGLSARELILCRYDFFPELINFGIGHCNKMRLLSASLKNFNRKKWYAKKYLNNVYQSFDTITAVNEVEQKRFSQLLSLEVSAFDYRGVQILQRLARVGDTLGEALLCYDELSKYLTSRKMKNFIFGSFWNQDLSLFEGGLDLSQQLFALAPHNLDKKTLQDLRTYFEQKNIRVFEINSDTSAADFLKYAEDHSQKGGIFLFNIKGILCELYGLFDIAYIGGGFGKSIHSVLEPALAGCKVFVGPKTYRSSEFDDISMSNPNQINQVARLSELRERLLHEEITFDQDKLKSKYQSVEASINDFLQRDGNA